MRSGSAHGRGLFETRSGGILLHVTSLPSRFGIGDLGPGAYRFIDFLARSRQHYWQVLPITTANYGCGCSPYNSVSAFALNNYLISPELMVQEGFLRRSDLRSAPRFPVSSIDFQRAIEYKDALFGVAFDRFRQTRKRKAGFARFTHESRKWLDDFALFSAIKYQQRGRPWIEWPEQLRQRDRKALAWTKKTLSSRIEQEKFLQYVCWKQWRDLRSRCRSSNIRIIGDVPIYVDFDSVDIWANPGIFKLDRYHKPLYVSGVPPDYFSDTGQLWGNPVYDWKALERTGFEWWQDRMEHAMSFFDYLRLDHFRGFVAFWQVPAGARTAKRGKWVKAPAGRFLSALRSRLHGLPLIAEDLGVITPDVREMMHRFRLPGMKVLVFAFGDGDSRNPYLPHNHTVDSVVYTGTHDNNTVRGWFEQDSPGKEKERLSVYLGKRPNGRSVHMDLIRLAMASVANTAIIPMQDILGLGARARMNHPGTVGRNWRWRLSRSQMSTAVADRLARMTNTYGRA